MDDDAVEVDGGYGAHPPGERVEDVAGVVPLHFGRVDVAQPRRPHDERVHLARFEPHLKYKPTKRPNGDRYELGQ